ncbi:unnamed protein product [Rodentolepis nana]|uniref:Uncharacterized protein n=1 Tax=Rodentolepis nana TaxID=102285 RepID=A0A0R3TZ75_RODNA|nr:unnamed protein product [Rodentolepis nana]
MALRRKPRNEYVENQRILHQEYANSAIKPVVIGSTVGLNLSGGNSYGPGVKCARGRQVKDIPSSNRGRSPSMRARHPPHTSPNIKFPAEDFGSRRSRYRDND